jgi:membrane protease YdiL (CAAX protease family)
VAKRNIADFGFTLSPQLALAFVLVSMLCAFFGKGSGTSWLGACVEAIARTGEEIFFRGFLFDIFYQLLSNKRWPWLWAAIASSILFASIHTQIFQQSFLNENGYPATPAFFIILQRLINVFGLALVFALLRFVTRSILPGAIAHSIVNGGILVVPFVLVIYFLAILWAYTRSEKILFGTLAQPK